MEYILIFISAIFVNNIILSQFLGICPFLGVSKKVETSLGMSAAVAFVLTLATIVTWCVQKFVLDPNGLGYLQTIAFILVIASLVQMVKIILKKVSPALYQALGIFLPLITTNCAVLGVAILVYSHRLWTGTDSLCRYARAAGTCHHPQGYAWHGYRYAFCRSALTGLHGFQWCRRRTAGPLRTRLAISAIVY